MKLERICPECKDLIVYKNKGSLNEQQRKTRYNDRIKNKLAKEKGFVLIRVWEDEIDNFNINKLK